MIVRILGEGQWTLEPTELDHFDELDERVEKAVANGNQEELTQALKELLAEVRTKGVEVPDDVIAESDLVLPSADATVEEVSGLLEGSPEYYGLIPDKQQPAE